MAGLVVWMNGQRVGTWTQRTTEVSEFEYAQSWIDSEFFRVLSLSIPVTTDRTVRGTKVTNYFDNLLPDNPDIRKRLSVRWSVRAETFALLSAIGRDCVGAVHLLPQDEQPDGWDRIRAVPLNEKAIADHLRKVTSPAGGFGSQEDDDDFRISTPGAQEKTALLKMGGTWYRPEGATPTTHILKLPLGIIANQVDFKDSVPNEWLCAEFVHAIGMNVARAEILRFEDQEVLGVRRFDRRWMDAGSKNVDTPGFRPKRGTHIARLPQEDFCQVFGLPSDRKYENRGGPSIKDILKILNGSENASDDTAHFVVSQLLFWLLAAPDGHAKNFSLQFTAGGGYRLTPLYDVLSAWPVIGKKAKQLQYEKVKLAMAIRGENAHYRLREVQARHWKELAISTGVDGLWERMIDTVEDANPAMAKIEGGLPRNFPDRVYRTIRDGVATHVRSFKHGLKST